MLNFGGVTIIYQNLRARLTEVTCHNVWWLYFRRTRDTRVSHFVHMTHIPTTDPREDSVNYESFVLVLGVAAS